jgi:hypothetical protein
MLEADEISALQDRITQQHVDIQNGMRIASNTVDPRKAQLLALFDLCDARGKEYLMRVAGVTATMRKE